MFSLPMTKMKVLDVVVLSRKNRQPDENPGVKLILQMSLPNHILIEFDPYLRGFLFTKEGAEPNPQSGLDGVPAISDLPDLTHAGAKVGTIKWLEELTGYELVIDHGLGGKRNISLDDCKLDGWRFTPKGGGSATVKVNVESMNMREGVFDKLAKLKSTEIQCRMTPPEVDQQQEIDDTPRSPPPPAQKDATDEFIARNKKAH